MKQARTERSPYLRAVRAVVQRVSSASVTVDGVVVGAVGRGVLVLLAVETGDADEDVAWLAGKVAGLRIFPDAEGQMNLDLAAVGGRALVVSQFTLLASTRKGRRPSYVRSARPAEAGPLYEAFCAAFAKTSGTDVARGVFGADMRVELVNDGPVTVIVDSRLRE